MSTMTSHSRSAKASRPSSGRMRVVIAGDFNPQADRMVGGIQAVIANTLAGLREIPDLDIHVVSCEKWDYPLSRKHPDQGWTYHYLRSSPHLPHTVTLWTVDRWRLARVIRSLSPDLVHAHGQAAAYPWAAFDTHLPVVITVHGLNGLEAGFDQRGGWLRGNLRAILWDRIERACLRRAAEIVVISPFVERYIRPYTHARLHHIENPVQAALFQLVREPRSGQILYVGSIQKRKGLADLIQALNQLRNHHPPVFLRVAGDCPPAFTRYGAEIRRLVDQLNLEDRVTFLGHLNRPALLTEYRQCSVFCLPSYLEASPVAVAEAMAAGCPTVTTTIGSTDHLIIDGENGRRYPPGDITALAECLNDLLADLNRQQVMGQRSRAIALSRFTPQQAARATYQLYVDLSR